MLKAGIVAVLIGTSVGISVVTAGNSAGQLTPQAQSVSATNESNPSPHIVDLSDNPVVWMVGEPAMEIVTTIPRRVGITLRDGKNDDLIWGEAGYTGRVEGTIVSDALPEGGVILAFYKDGVIQSRPTQLRKVAGLGLFVAEGLPDGEYWIVALSGDPAGPRLMGVNETWPGAVSVRQDTTATGRILLSKKIGDMARRMETSYLYRALPATDVIDPKHAVMGFVYDHAGRLLEGARVEIRGVDGAMSPSVFTNDEGFYFFSGADWPYRVGANQKIYRVGQPGLAWEYASLMDIHREVDKVDIHFRPLPEGKGTVRGRVVDDEGKPVSRFFAGVDSRNPTADREEEREQIRFGYTLAFQSQEGRFAIGNLPPGKYSVHCFSFGEYAGIPRKEVEVPEGGTAELEMTLVRMHRIYVKVVSAVDNSPVAGAWVTSDEENQLPGQGGRGTDEEGLDVLGVTRAQLESLKAGKSRLSVQANGYESSEKGGSAFAETPETAGVIRMTPLQKVQGPIAFRDSTGSFKVGNSLPDLELWDVDGHLRHLSDYRGRVVVLSFLRGRTDGEERIQGSYLLEDIWRRNREKGLVMLGVISARDENAARATILRYGFSFPVFMDTEGKLRNLVIPNFSRVRGLPDDARPIELRMADVGLGDWHLLVDGNGILRSIGVGFSKEALEALGEEAHKLAVKPGSPTDSAPAGQPQRN